MATFAIGDIHGCFRTLQHLVKAIRFDPGRDRLWLVGDLVNRGPRSLEVLRWVRQLGDRAVCVLGNHDLKLLACGLGARSSLKNPQLSSILAAPDRRELLAWLGSRPPVHREGGYVLVHAGLLPGWTVDQAIELGGEIQRSLAGPGAVELLKCLTARNLSEFKEKEPGSLRLATALRAMTQLRTLNRDGSMDLDFVGPLAEMPDDLIPGFHFQAGATAPPRLSSGIGPPWVVPGARNRSSRQQLCPGRPVDGHAIGRRPDHSAGICGLTPFEFPSTAFRLLLASPKSMRVLSL